MSFPQARFDSFAKKLNSYIRKCLRAQYVFMPVLGFDVSEFEEKYVESFKSEFPECINDEILGKLQLAGKNVLYALESYIAVNQEYDLDYLMDFAEEMLFRQLKNFLYDYDLPEWCDERYEENSDENWQRKEITKEKGKPAFGSKTNIL
jgi:hypothetical protein